QAAGPVLRPEKPVAQALFSSDSKLVLTRSDGIVQFWSADTGHPVGSPIRHAGSGTRTLAISPNGKTVLTGGSDRAAMLWSVETRQRLGALMLHQENVRAVAFSPDGRSLFTGSD